MNYALAAYGSFFAMLAGYIVSLGLRYRAAKGKTSS